MKKIAVVWSSPNKDGLTASAKGQFVKGLELAGAEVNEIHLNSKKMEHCRVCGNGWGTCNKNGSCVIQDDFAEIYKTLTLCPSENGPVNWGHCGVSHGDGRVIHAWDIVRIDDYLAIEDLTALTGDHPKYLGWVALKRVLEQTESGVCQDRALRA